MKGLGALLVLDATCTWLGIFSLDRPEHDSLQRNLGALSFLHPFPSASLKHSLFSCFYVYAGVFFFKNFYLLIFGCAGSLLGVPCGSAGKESARNAGDQGSIPGLGRSPGEGKGSLLQYSDLENSI